MEWSPAAVDAWAAIRTAEATGGAVGMGYAAVALLTKTLPSSVLRAALRDNSVWPMSSAALHGQAQLGNSGFMLYDLPAAVEAATQKEGARRVTERHIAMALAGYGQGSFDSFGVQANRLVEKVRLLELGEGFQPSETEGRWHGLIDTSIAIEYHSPHEIKWVKETSSERVTIWISPVLLDELDDMKFHSRNTRVRTRAQAWTRWVNPLIAKALTPGGAPMPNQKDVVLRAWSPALQATAPDSRHLEAAFALLDRQVPIKLITGDSGQRLRALANRIEVFDLSEDWLLPTEESLEEARAARLADQRKADIRPRLRERWMGMPEHFRFAVYNVGGPADKFVWVGCGRGRLYVSRGSVPEHFTQYTEFGSTDLGPIPAESELAPVPAQTLWLVAKDIDGDWWDCASDEHIKRDPRAYLAGELTRRNLEAFAGRIFEEGRLE
jgi:hypothetical protein